MSCSAVKLMEALKTVGNLNKDMQIAEQCKTWH